MPMTLTELDTKIAEFNKEAAELKAKRDALADAAAGAGLNKRFISQRLAAVVVKMPESQ